MSEMTPEPPEGEEALPPEGDGDIRPAMTLDQIKAANLTVDLPFEAGSADPLPLSYGDPEEMEADGVEAWVPPEGFPERWRAEVSGLAVSPETLDTDGEPEETPPGGEAPAA